MNKQQLEHFIEAGFVRVDNAFSRQIAAEAREILWRDTGSDPADPTSWTRPVVRLGFYNQAPFRKAVNAPTLHEAFNQLVGDGRWLPRQDLGTFPIRFPSNESAGDDGWHVDASFPGDNPADYFSYRVNIHSQGRALLMLFLFSDVSEHDAPTRIRVGSHMNVARTLLALGERGLSFMELAGALDSSANNPTALATGKAGTVYLCHPFLAHAAQRHRGTEPKFMAQPPLHLIEPLKLERADKEYSTVEIAIRRAIASTAS